LVEEIRARGSFPVWRRDDDGPRTLRITKQRLQAIRVEDEPIEVGASEPDEIPTARRASQRTTSKASDGPRKNVKGEQAKPACPRGGSKQANVIALLSGYGGCRAARIDRGEERPEPLLRGQEGRDPSYQILHRQET
jgi:hypothetical protein